MGTKVGTGMELLVKMVIVTLSLVMSMGYDRYGNEVVEMGRNGNHNIIPANL